MNTQADYVADGCIMVICGAAGDLTKRLLIPALCHLGAAGHLHEQFTVVGFAHSKHNTASFRAYFADAVRDFVQNVWSKLQTAFQYFQENVMPKVLEVIKMLADYWQNELAPALLEAWQNIQPALNALGELVQRVFGFIVGYIQNFLLPVLGILVGVS